MPEGEDHPQPGLESLTTPAQTSKAPGRHRAHEAADQAARHHLQRSLKTPEDRGQSGQWLERQASVQFS